MDMQSRYARIDEAQPLTDARGTLAGWLRSRADLSLGPHAHSLPQICLNDQKKFAESAKLARRMRHATASEGK
jgi:hypothetical protein